MSTLYIHVSMFITIPWFMFSYSETVKIVEYVSFTKSKKIHANVIYMIINSEIS